MTIKQIEQQVQNLTVEQQKSIKAGSNDSSASSSIIIDIDESAF